MAILFKKDFEFDIIDLTISKEISLRLINIYAPNTDKPAFFEHVENLLLNHNNDYTIICGDFNMTLDPDMDSLNYISLNNPRSRQFVLNMKTNHSLIDAFRHLNPNLKRYSWRRKNPTKHARLDYFLISDTLSDLLQSSKIIPGYHTDRSIIQIAVILNHFERGRGTWKLNCNLLKNIDYINTINTIIDEEKIKYSVPVYNPTNLHRIEDELLSFTIKDNMFLEMLLLRIRGETIKISSRLKKKENEREKSLINEIQILEENSNLSQINN